ncbi:MAG TPA: S1 RNA-binding domain-containing protein [Verrucomicrobiae bacterium]|nr:S1 RNA-binding domain-containing protein [Verrucomicrobiae bacterium]
MPKKATTADSAVTMQSLLTEMGGQAVPFVPGSVIEGTVISSSSTRVWVDIQGVAVGVIPDRELSVLSNELKPGDPVIASVLLLEDKKGNTILSLRRADRERISNELNARVKDGQPTQIKITDANKGGLLVEMGDFSGFLPVSQLASEHYPRVDGGNPDEIFAKLKELVGQMLTVKVLTFDPQQGKLIFSEKAAGDAAQEEKLKNIKEGDILEGTITGIVDFGIFVRLGRDDSSLEGLVHISEIAWGRVTDINSLYQPGQSVKVLVVSTADNRVSLSIKRLLPDPWQEAASKYKVNDLVSGQVTRITPFGVFVRLDNEIDGLVHISEISSERITDPGTILHQGESYQFKIISIDPAQHRLGLSFKRLNEPDKAEDAPADATEGQTEEKPKKAAKKPRKKLLDDVDTAVAETEEVKTEVVEETPEA